MSLYPFGSWPRVGLSALGNAAAARRQAGYPCHPYPLRLDRAPWPPSFLRQAPTARVSSPGCCRISPVARLVSTDSPFPFQLPDSPGPLPIITWSTAPRPAGSAGYPCPFRLDRAPWPPSSCARLPTLESHPRAPTGFPARGGSPGSVLSPRGSRTRLGLLGVHCNRVLRLLRFAATPVHYGRTEPPGRLPSCARLPTSQSPKLAGLLTRQRPAPFPLRLSGLSWASPRCLLSRGTAAYLVCTLPLSAFARQCYQVYR
jgi:hypothetical protein